MSTICERCGVPLLARGEDEAVDVAPRCERCTHAPGFEERFVERLEALAQRAAEHRRARRDRREGPRTRRSGSGGSPGAGTPGKEQRRGPADRRRRG